MSSEHQCSNISFLWSHSEETVGQFSSEVNGLNKESVNFRGYFRPFIAAMLRTWPCSSSVRSTALSEKALRRQIFIVLPDELCSSAETLADVKYCFTGGRGCIPHKFADVCAAECCDMAIKHNITCREQVCCWEYTSLLTLVLLACFFIHWISYWHYYHVSFGFVFCYLFSDCLPLSTACFCSFWLYLCILQPCRIREQREVRSRITKTKGSGSILLIFLSLSVVLLCLDISRK